MGFSCTFNSYNMVARALAHLLRRIFREGFLQLQAGHSSERLKVASGMSWCVGGLILRV
jgi:hypothetical protein